MFFFFKLQPTRWIFFYAHWGNWTWVLLAFICLAFGSNTKSCGWAWGLLHCGRWWIIQTSGQITSGSPLRLGTVESSREPSSQACQQRVSWLWRLPTHCSVSLPGIFILPLFPFIPIFHCQFLLILLVLGDVSFSTNRSCFNTILLLILVWECSWFKVKLFCRWAPFDWFHLLLLLPKGRSVIMMRGLRHGCSTWTLL